MNRILKKLRYFSFAGLLCLIPSLLAGQTDTLRNFHGWVHLSNKELSELGRKEYQAEQYDKALQIFMIITSRYSESDKEEDQRFYTNAFIRCGNTQYQMLDYASAMDFYLKALKIAEMNRFDDYIGSIYGHIGNIYAANHDYESAASAYQTALPYAYDFKMDNLKSMLLNNLGGTYYFLEKLDSAEYYFNLFRDLQYNDPRFTYDVFLNQSLLFNAKHMNDSAILYAKKAIGEAEKNRLSLDCIGSCNSSIAQFFEEENLLDSALFYLHWNERIAKETGSNDLLMASFRALGRVYEKLRNQEKTLTYKSEYLSISDSILSQKDYNELKNKQIFHELERQSSTINDLNAVRIRQRDGLLILTVVLLVFILMMGMLYRQKKRLSAAWADLFERNHRYLSEEILYKQKIQSLEQSLREARSKITDRKEVSGGKETEQEDTETNFTGNRKMIVHEEQRKQIVRDILRVMETTEEYCAMDYSIDKLAVSIGCSPRYVSEVLNEELGKNFRAMLNEYRIKKAMIRLSDVEHYGHLTIKAIAESVGYKSQTTFIMAFTKFTGLKPGLYQKLAVEHYGKEESLGTDNRLDDGE